MANGQQSNPFRALRWYVARLIPEDAPEEASMQVGISTARLENELAMAPQRQTTALEWLSSLESDDLGFWEEDPFLEGLASIAELKLMVRPIPGAGELAGPPIEEREIREHMVFVQVLPNEPALLQRLQQTGQSDDLSEALSFAADFMWVDFTIQAREMAKKIYSSAFGA